MTLQEPSRSKIEERHVKAVEAHLVDGASKREALEIAGIKSNPTNAASKYDNNGAIQVVHQEIINGLKKSVMLKAQRAFEIISEMMEDDEDKRLQFMAAKEVLDRADKYAILKESKNDLPKHFDLDSVKKAIMIIDNS